MKDVYCAAVQTPSIEPTACNQHDCEPTSVPSPHVQVHSQCTSVTTLLSSDQFIPLFLVHMLVPAANRSLARIWYNPIEASYVVSIEARSFLYKSWQKFEQNFYQLVVVLFSSRQYPCCLAPTCRHARLLCADRWRTHGFGPCSAICGGGHQTRRVVCVQETRRDPPDSRVLPDERCRPPIPPRLLLCNLKDCPASWETSPWSQVSDVFGQEVELTTWHCTRPFRG